MASSGDESTRPNSTRNRRSTPRLRIKKIAVMETKRTPPRRRVSPRSFHQRQEEKDREIEKQHETMKIVSETSASDHDQAEDKRTEKIEMEQQHDTLLPAQDTQLRRNYLQRIYRHLQSTHPNQDDTIIRQVATKMEMEVCQKAVTKNEYTAAMDQEIHKIMQFEIAQTHASMYTKEDQRFDNLQGTNPTQVSHDGQSGFSPSHSSHARSSEYAQALAKAQTQEMNTGGRSSAYSTPRQSISGGSSFQSLMTNQTQAYGLDGSQQQQQTTPNRVSSMQNLQPLGNPYFGASPMVSPTGQTYGFQSNVGNPPGQNVPRYMMQPPQQSAHFHMQPQYMQQSARSQHRGSSFHEFSAQIQHLDKSVLIELLWNQRNALARWQRQAKQLELRLSSAQHNSVNHLSGAAFQSPYNSPVVGGGNFVNPNISAEAAMQRAQERTIARNVMTQISYTQQSQENSPAYSQAGGNGLNWGENVQAYWDKVRELKSRYAEQLHIAKRALANNSAPPNTVYSVKAQSVMENIGLVINILDEQPIKVQPRKFDVLTSIERFIQITVIPIVRKVQSSYMTSASSAAMASGSFPAAASSGSAHASDTSLSQDDAGDTPEQYVHTGTECSNSRRDDRSRQLSHSDSAAVNNSPSRHDEESTDPSIRIKDELLPSDSPIKSGETSSVNAPVRPTSDDTAAMQSERSTEKASAYEASKEQLAAPTSEFRLPTVSDMRPPSSPSGVLKESKGSQSHVDVLNDFTDFPELDFDEENSFVKVNHPSNGSRKRGIEEV